MQRRIGGFASDKLSEPPAAGRRVFPGVLDHELNAVHGRPGHKRLATTEDFVVLLRQDVFPGEPGNDGAVRERKFSFPADLERDFVRKCAPEESRPFRPLAEFVTPANPGLRFAPTRAAGSRPLWG